MLTADALRARGAIVGEDPGRRFDDADFRLCPLRTELSDADFDRLNQALAAGGEDLPERIDVDLSAFRALQEQAGLGASRPAFSYFLLPAPYSLLSSLLSRGGCAMSDTVRIQMLGNFLIYIGEQRVENPVAKSRKGAALVSFLVLNEGRGLTKQQLLRALWDDHKLNNPDNALKTLVSRMRTILNAMSPELGGCIASERGSYRWQSMPGVRVDVLELMKLLADARVERDRDALRGLYRRIMELYAGDLFQTGEIRDEAAYVRQIHARYLETVYAYVEMLRQSGEFDEISAVCRTALEVDAFDDRLHIELMRAMASLDREGDALAQYKHATNLSYRYLGAGPSEEMKAFYRQMSLSRKTLKFYLDTLRDQLLDDGGERGAFLCGYSLFRKICNLERHSLERLGAAVFLGVIMIGDSEDAGFDSVHQESVMDGLLDICRSNMQPGDVITHFAPTVVALLLPAVNRETGTMVMERLRQAFYKRFPNSEISFRYRLGALGGTVEEPDDPPGEPARE